MSNLIPYSISENEGRLESQDNNIIFIPMIITLSISIMMHGLYMLIGIGMLIFLIIYREEKRIKFNVLLDENKRKHQQIVKNVLLVMSETCYVNGRLDVNADLDSQFFTYELDTDAFSQIRCIENIYKMLDGVEKWSKTAIYISFDNEADLIAFKLMYPDNIINGLDISKCNKIGIEW